MVQVGEGEKGSGRGGGGGGKRRQKKLTGTYLIVPQSVQRVQGSSSGEAPLSPPVVEELPCADRKMQGIWRVM